MCPSKHILSIYFDGELPGPFKEKLEAHLASCPSCAAALQGFARLSRGLSGGAADGDEGAKIQAAKERLWAKLDGVLTGETPRGAAFAPPRPALWRRDVRLPFPLAAAAGFALVFLFSLFLFRAKERPLAAEIKTEDTLISISGPLEDGGAELVNAENMGELLQFLENDSDANMVIIRLPETRNFNRYGEARLLNASDHPRKKAPQ
jgi:hypothetical protein